VFVLAAVAWLAYTAYSLATQTLTLPFVWSESQRWNVLELAVSPPTLKKVSTTDMLLDESAIRASLARWADILSQETVSGEYSILVTGGYLRLVDNRSKKDDTVLTLDSKSYNKLKQTPYRLPRNITLTPSDVPKGLDITRIGDARDQTYSITLYGLGDGVSPSDIRYYTHYDEYGSCSLTSWESTWVTEGITFIENPKMILSGEAKMSLPERRLTFEEIDPIDIVAPTLQWPRWVSQIQLPYDMDASRTCIIAWVWGLSQIVEDRRMKPFALTGSLISSLSPEFDMKSQIEILFSHDIYSDSGTLYSPEYIAHRWDAKIEFLKHFDITPHIDITPDMLMLTPDRAVLTLPLEDAREYDVSIRDLEDVYGRTASMDTRVKPESGAFLSLKLRENKQIYTIQDTIEAKLYTLKSPKKTYSLKLCSVGLESYARLERLNTNQSRAKNSIVADVFSKGTDCRTRDIVVTASGYVSPLRIDDFSSSGARTPGLYALWFANPDDLTGYERYVPPVIFSVIDTHITMKVDASGKMMFLATDIQTGKPRADLDVTLLRNVSRTHIEKWNPTTQVVEKEYIPFTSQAFATGVVVGKTTSDGYVDTKVDSLKWVEWYDSSPYGLAFDSWWSYEGRYDSFLVVSRGGGHLGYLVSTWNDGITGYNFGIQDSDYSWMSRGRYTSYLHADRRLYLPGETVHIHAILRENTSSLTIPRDATFDLSITDPLGREVQKTTLNPNDFGAISLDLTLPKDTPLGSYNMSISPTNSTDYIENSWGNFQVEVFKNPTFTATVELKSDDIQDGSVKNLRKIHNTDPYSPWYDDVYTGDMTIQGIVRAKYYNGAEIKNAPFTYRVYRSTYYPEDYWGDCFWWCYYEPPLEQFTEWSGSIDGDGYGILRIPVEFRSSYSDYSYVVEVTIRDPLTGEEVTTPGSLIVKLPSAYKAFAFDNPLVFTPKKRILAPTEVISGKIEPEYGKWDASFSGRYLYEVIRRDYSESWVEDIRLGKTRVTSSTDVVVLSGSVMTSDISLKLSGAKPGEYRMRVSPMTVGGATPPESSVSESIFYISGPVMSLGSNTLRVIPEKTVYQAGETAKVMFQVPFTGAYLLITKEKWWVIDREYLYLSGNTLTREYRIDDTFLPNAYIWVVALKPGVSSSDASRSYAVWYGEIVTDIAEKKSLLTIKPDKDQYKNRETANVDLTLTDRSGNPLIGEVTVMVVDESLIRLLGNIDLDIIPKFFQKYPFTVKTSLTAIGIERSQFLSRKGSNGGWGNKWWGGVDIASRTIFENTAYYNPSVITDTSGLARVTFTLPDNITNYRIIAIANTKDSRFSVAEKPIEVRKDYVIETRAPMIVRKWDNFTLIAQVFNSTSRITPVDVILRIGTGATQIEQKKSLTLDIQNRKASNFQIGVLDGWKDIIPYTIEIREGAKILDAYTSSIRLAPLPLLTDTYRNIRVFSGVSLTETLPASLLRDVSLSGSIVDITVSNSYLTEFRYGLEALLTYPYGCIEQTIASTLPNRIAMSLTQVLGQTIDSEQAKKNISEWLAKILRMQHPSGGWVYWEWSTEVEPHITPYVIRSLLRFRDLWEIVPNDVLTRGADYIIANEIEYLKSMDDYAEATWALSSLSRPEAIAWWNKIDSTKLSRHGHIAYLFSAQKLGKYTLDLEKAFLAKLDSWVPTWYWTKRSDQALFVELLLARGERERALVYLDPLLRTLDLSSYYVSTQEKIQLLLTLISDAQSIVKLQSPQTIALRSDWLISDVSITPTYPTGRTISSREKIGSSYTLKRALAWVPLIVTTRIQDTPLDITTLPAYGTGGIRVSRTFTRIDESKWVDKDGQFVSMTPVQDMTFQKGTLYKVTLTATIDTWTPNSSWSHLAIEDYFPGAWRPIHQNFRTESSQIQDQHDTNWWTHREAHDDRILAHLMYGWDKERTFTYYFRPDLIGTYTLPPATAYFMYDPSIHAYTAFSKIQIIE
jgi:uncharacterized protein YfaS (alpha-2-macroglobulin family)